MSACSASIDEEQSKTAEAVQKILENPVTKTDQTIGDVSLNLPFRAKIEASSENNIIITKGSNQYILFWNPNEDQSSKLLYELGIEDEEDIVDHGSFEDEDRFGYYIIREINQEDGLYELVVGTGGVKMTTQSEAADLSSHAEMMMEIVTSIKFK